MIPRATYRFQFHEGFTFSAAEALVPYLDELGISHVYASPITTAAAGSTHGYDVVDPTRINPELGGEAAFRSLVGALRARKMGIIVDIVPNHMGVAGGGNAWWNDVLEKGEASPHARVFDIDWRERLVLPVLGEPLEAALADGALAIEQRDGRFTLIAYGENRFPIRDEDQAGLRGAVPKGHALRALLDRQHYRLAWWRVANDELNWRRFFTISDLAGVRIEDADVFEATHALIFRLYREGLADGVRVDHVDGLTDPASYCRALRARLDTLPRPAEAPAGPAYVVVEKILASGERLAEDWGLDGTSGYDFMETVSAVLHDPAGEAALGALWGEISGRSPDFGDEELLARQEMLSWQFEGQLERTVEAFVALASIVPDVAGLTHGMLRRAITRLLWVFPVYRTYGTGDAAPPCDAAIRKTARERITPHIPPGEASVIDRVLAWLAGDAGGDAALAREAVRRFQQLSAPIAAKAVEDTAFYRYGRLLSRTDVGFDPLRFAGTIDDFHAVIADAARAFPHRLLATATHDHKRGEDVRARLAVLSGIAGEWRAQVIDWRRMNAPRAEGVDPADEYMLYQTLVGAWPGSDRLAGFADRIVEFERKALREAKLRSSWEAPDAAYEGRVESFIRATLGADDFVAAIDAFVTRIAPAALANTLAQVALRFTVPGVPDVYQGSELADFTLVDPDNRRPVDYSVRAALLRTGKDAKLDLIAEILDLRRRYEDMFESGDYQPLAVIGGRSENVLAFRRRAGERTLTVAVMLRNAQTLVGADTPVPKPSWWGDTTIGDGAEAINAADLFALRPVWISLADVDARHTGS